MKRNFKILLIILSVPSILTACEIAKDETSGDGKLIYWHDEDAFTGVKGSYLDTKLWIDSESGKYLDLQFQCFRHPDTHYPNEFNLLVGSRIEASHGTAQYLDVVLYKRDDQPAQVYRRGDWGDILSTFQNASLNVHSIFAEDGDGNLPNQVKFRFVYEASPLEAELGEVASLSRAPAVDLTINASDPEVRRFLRDCSPKASGS